MGAREKVEALLMEHVQRRPLMAATDVYKLLYQEVFGVGHILGEGARARLLDEAETVNLEDHPEEPLIEAVSPEGSMVRVNLRPYLRKGLSLEALYEAMLETAEIEGDPAKFLEAWNVFKELVKNERISINWNEVEALDKEIDETGVHPHHHSEAYREAYYPAYRVVKRDALYKILR